MASSPDGALLLLLLACGAPELSPDREALELAKEAPPPLSPPVPQASTLPEGAPEVKLEVKLVWSHVGRTHQSFFAGTSFVDLLAVGLTGLARSPAALQIRYDEATAKGQIHLSAPKGALLIRPRREGARLVLQDLSPVLESLATYRSAVSGRYDLRILNFHTAIEAEDGGHRCIVSVPEVGAGDGKVVSPCVEVDGVNICGEPTAEGVIFPLPAAEAISACFGGA